MDEKRILVLDDDRNTLVFLHYLLEQKGYSVTSVKNGGEAIRKCNAHIPHLIISDISLPVMDGLEFCRAIRRDPRWFATPLIFYSADSSQETRLCGYESGASDFMTKPMIPEQILHRVDFWFNRFNSYCSTISPK